MSSNKTESIEVNDSTHTAFNLKFSFAPQYLNTAVWGYYRTNDANVGSGRLKDWSSKESYSTGAMTLVGANTHIQAKNRVRKMSGRMCE